jgi:hypothetical protein
MIDFGEDGANSSAGPDQRARTLTYALLSIALLLVQAGRSAQAAPPTGAVPPGIKKGIGIWIGPKDGGRWLREARALKVGWFYTWWYTKPPELPEDLEFVPMLWSYYGNKNGETGRTLDRLKATVGARYLLGYNEPDSSTEGNLSVDRALEAWPLLMHTGLPLGSPGATHPDNDWMRDFMKGAEARRYRVDFVCIHWYGDNDPQGFLDLLRRVHELYHRPLWITEFGVVDWKADKTHPSKYTPEDEAAFMRAVLPQLDRLDYVQRYAWFSGDTSDPNYGPSVLFNADGTLNGLGEVYASLGNADTKDARTTKP